MKPEEKLRYLILGAQREGNRMLASLLAPLGLTPSQAEVLRCLADAEALSLKALGGRLVCETGSPSRLVSTMLEKGLVERKEDPEDRRQVIIILTPEGRSKEAAVQSLEAQLHSWITARLSSETIEELSAGLERLLDETQAGCAVAERSSSAKQAS